MRIFQNCGISSAVVSWVIGELTKPLTETTNNENTELVTWGPEREQAFKAIKWCLLLLSGSQIIQIPSICT